MFSIRFHFVVVVVVVGAFFILNLLLPFIICIIIK